LTDDAGAFAFRDLPAGDFTISASKIAYVTTEYGAKRPGRAGTPVHVLAGDQLDNLTIPLARGAVIAGRVLDAGGRPIPEVEVAAIRAELVDRFLASPSSTSGNAATQTTDDEGSYRFYGLEPGTYAVAATPRATEAGMMESGSTSGNDALLAQLRSRTDKGPITAISGGDVRAPLPNRMLAPVYFPGTPVLTEAQRVVLGSGEQRESVDIVMRPVRSVVLEGTLATTEGSPVTGVTLSLSPTGPVLPPSRGAQPTLSIPPDGSGRFKYIGVAPGVYTLTARRASSPVPLMGTARVLVTDDTRVALTLEPMATVNGRLVFEGVPAPSSVEMTRARIQLLAPDATPIPAAAGLARSGGTTSRSSGGTVVSPARDGTWSFGAMAPGPYRLVVDVPGGWWARSATLNGRDVLDALLVLGPGDSFNLVITLSNQHSAIQGTLRASPDQSVSDCFLVVFPTDRSLWLRGTRRLKAVRPSTSGAFVFRNLPPGDYFLAALADLDPEEWQEATFLTQVESAAVRVTLAEGETRTQDLRIGR
jgi:uncharacterized protein (DUF2141 family)